MAAVCGYCSVLTECGTSVALAIAGHKPGTASGYEVANFAQQAKKYSNVQRLLQVCPMTSSNRSLMSSTPSFAMPRPVWLAHKTCLSGYGIKKPRQQCRGHYSILYSLLKTLRSCKLRRAGIIIGNSSYLLIEVRDHIAVLVVGIFGSKVYSFHEAIIIIANILYP